MSHFLTLCKTGGNKAILVTPNHSTFVMPCEAYHSFISEAGILALQAASTLINGSCGANLLSEGFKCHYEVVREKERGLGEKLVNLCH